MTSAELLASLEKNIDNLLRERETLQQEVSRLSDANDRQRQEMIQTHKELADLREEYKTLKIAHALVSDSEEREQVKRKLTRMIHLIDKTISNLKSEIDG